MNMDGSTQLRGNILHPKLIRDCIDKIYYRHTKYAGEQQVSQARNARHIVHGRYRFQPSRAVGKSLLGKAMISLVHTDMPCRAAAESNVRAAHEDKRRA